jgi:hypothetical protein
LCCAVGADDGKGLLDAALHGFLSRQEFNLPTHTLRVNAQSSRVSRGTRANTYLADNDVVQDMKKLPHGIPLEAQVFLAGVIPSQRAGRQPHAHAPRLKQSTPRQSNLD